MGIGLSGLKNRLLAKQIEEEILHYIVETPISIGSRLPNEFELGERFGAGRSTIREAIKALASRGIVEVRQGSGTYVAAHSSAVDDPLGIRLFADKGAIALDLADVRFMIEPAMAETAAIRATEKDIQKLRSLCNVVEQKILAGENYTRDDIAFHSCIAECSKNKITEQLIPIINTAVMLFVNITHKQLTEETIRTHRAITEAIADHDPIGARSAMTTHIALNREFIRSASKKEEGSL